jgi:hypothetical protein
LDTEGKGPYEKKHNQDADRYKKQCDELDKNGFFMMADGSKSSEHKAKLKKRAKKGEKEEKKAEKAAKKKLKTE